MRTEEKARYQSLAMGLRFPRILWLMALLAGPGATAGDAGSREASGPSLSGVEMASALVLRGQVDRYLELSRRVFRPALYLGSPTHRRDAKYALESLAYLRRQTSRALAGRTFHLEDQIDIILLEHLSADLEDRLKQSLKDEEDLLTILPAGAARLRLPNLKGLLQAEDLESGRKTMEWLRAGIPAPWAPLPDNLGMNIFQAAKERAEMLEKEIEHWYTRVEDRFPDAAPSLKDSVKSAREGLKTFEEHLENKVIPTLEKTNAVWGSPVGEARFRALLRNRHMITESPDELLTLGRDQLSSIHREIAAIAAKIDAKVSHKEVWQRLKKDHPSRESLPQFAFDEMRRSLALLLEKDAVTIPINARKNLMLLTEEETYDTYPFGGYGGYELRGDQFIGFFMTSPPKSWTEPEAAAARLMGNNYYWARVVAVHEIYPGHHLQSVITDLKARPIRKHYYTTTLGEGWGLYSEQMMYRLGFFPDDETYMAMLMMRAWRAARVVIDVSLHLGGMSFEEAVSFLMENVDMNKENATAEVRRYLGNPTRPLSYLYGYLQIERLRQEYRKLRGASFSEKDFHDRLLSYGAIPLPLIRASMLGEPLPGRSGP